MKLIALLSHLKQQYRHLRRTNDVLRISLPSFLIFLGLSIIVLLFGQYVSIAGYVPLESSSKRVQCIFGLFLIWVMKWMLVDLAHPIFTWQVSANTKKKWRLLEERLDGAWRFLRLTRFTEHGKKSRLSSLPWFLLIGPHKAGKTALLSKSSVKYILQKRSTEHEVSTANTTDFWATRHAVFVETCGDELGFSMLHDGRKVDRDAHDMTWRYFLSWLKRMNRAQSTQGVLLALPYSLFTLSDKMQRYAAKRLIERLSALSDLKKQSIPLYIVITQCDRMSGFAPYFHGLSQEESEQLFGVQLSKQTTPETVLQDVKEQCERLIKQVNQQLIYKLHHEPNIAAKPFIKEFPLQLEQLKRSLCDLLKRLEPAFSYVNLEGVFFTSAQQEIRETKLSSDALETDSTSIQVYAESNFTSRAYFVKSLFTQLPHAVQKQVKKAVVQLHQKIRLQYALPLCMIVIASALFTQDFIQGLAIERSMSQVVAHHQQQYTTLTLSQAELKQTFSTLDKLNKIEEVNKDKSQHRVFSFYTKRSLSHVHQAYLKSLDSYLLPLLQKNLTGTLLQSNNYDAQAAYAMLKAYLMLTSVVPVDATYFHYALLNIEPFHSQKELADELGRHLPFAFQSQEKVTLNVDKALVQNARQYLWYLSKERLAYIILSNQNNYFVPMELPWKHQDAAWLIAEHDFYIPMLFSAKSVTTILTSDVLKAAKEAMIGNDVLGLQREQNAHESEALLMSNVRNIYIQAYANYWERLLSRVTLKATGNLSEWEKSVILFKNNDSVFNEFLQLVYDNTYFDPIISISPRLQSLDLLLDKNQANAQQLALIKKSIDNLHDYVKPVLMSSNQAKAAFELTSKRMQDQRVVDPLTQLRLVADKSPEPMKTWLHQVANQLWAHLMHEASQYINLAWQEKIGKFYITHLSNHYPFDSKAKEDVSLEKFKLFFGTTGSLVQFYQHYLDSFIDYEDKAWRWKTVEAERLPFSDEILKQMQLGLRIHDAFFPNGDDELSVQFSLAARQWGGELKQVTININDQKIIDNASKKEKHLLQWPNQSTLNSSSSSIQFVLQNQQRLTREYSGEWGLFRLVEDTFDTMLSKNELMLDLSPDDYPAKYVINTKEPISPFSTVKLAYFQLPEKLRS